MPRQARLDTPGSLHHIMVRGIERRNIFRSDRDRNDLIGRLSSLLPETKTACYAWAFLPNHAHFLFRSGPSGIAFLMRKLLTGYVVSFNRRHRRTGHLFQNRYKSVICQEDVYFTELVRYIHLNPIRANIVSTLEALDHYPYSGHMTLLGNKERQWQEKDYVLKYFGDAESNAVPSYRSFIKSGINQGKQETLSRGGLLRSYGGWTELRKQDQRVKGDQRILGDNNFVLSILAEGKQSLEQRTLLKMQGYTAEKIADYVAQLYGLTMEDVLSTGRQADIVEVRSVFCYIAARQLGMSVTDLARLLSLTPSAVSYAVQRGKRIADEKGISLTGESN